MTNNMIADVFDTLARNNRKRGVDMSEEHIELLRIISELKTSDSRTNQALGAEISRHVVVLQSRLTALQLYAEHLEACGACADYVGNCQEGLQLRRKAMPDAGLLSEEVGVPK